MADNEILLAGAAEVDITPALDIQIGGDIGRRRPAAQILERLCVRSLALECAEKRFCILSLDLLEITEPYDQEIRRRAAKYGFASDAVMVHPVQNHAAPALGNEFWSEEYQEKTFPAELWWLGGVDRRYIEPVLDGIEAAIRAASERLRPATVRTGRTIDGRVAFNRRFILRDGTAVCHPGQSVKKRILQPEGVVDPEVGVMVLTAADGSPIAALLHHTCHPCHGGGSNNIIAGWPGAWASSMRSALGTGCIPLVINGCCGNIHNVNHMDPSQNSSHIRMGAMLAESACGALRELEPAQKPGLSWCMETLHLAPRKISSDELAKAHELAAQPIPFSDSGKTAVSWDWIYAHSVIDLAARIAARPSLDYPVQAVRIGESVLVALSGEPFVEVQLRLKRESPFPCTFVAHMANGGVGYIPTADALKRGGYETRTANWSKYAPEALEVIGDCALGLIQRV